MQSDTLNPSGSMELAMDSTNHTAMTPPPVTYLTNGAFDFAEFDPLNASNSQRKTISDALDVDKQPPATTSPLQYRRRFIPSDTRSIGEQDFSERFESSDSEETGTKRSEKVESRPSPNTVRGSFPELINASI